MGLVWNMSAFIATIALLLIGGAIWSKAKSKSDSPINRIIERFKRKKPEQEVYDETKYYRRIKPGGVKWVWL